MKGKQCHRKPNYNAQLSMDAEAGMIVAGDVNDAREDSGYSTGPDELRWHRCEKGVMHRRRSRRLVGPPTRRWRERDGAPAP
jgi:hypothetical protein